MRIKFDPPIHIDRAMNKYDTRYVSFLLTPDSYPNVIGIEFEDFTKISNPYINDNIDERVVQELISYDLKKRWVMVDKRNLLYIPKPDKEGEVYRKYISALDTVNRKSDDFPAPIARRIARAAARFNLNVDIFNSFSVRHNSTAHSAYRFDIHDIGVVPEYFLRNGMMNVGGVWLDEFTRTFVHEYGHSVWHRVLSPEDQKAYEDLAPRFTTEPETEEGTPTKGKNYSLKGDVGYSDWFTYEEDTFVTTYARWNIKEDWSESFLYYKVAPRKLKELSRERYDFIKRMDEKAQDFGPLEKKDEIVTGKKERFSVVELLPVDLQLTTLRRELAKRFKVELHRLVRSKSLGMGDVKCIIPIGDFARQKEYPDELEAVVYIPHLDNATTIVNNDIRMIVVNHKQKFEELAYQYKYIESEPEKPLKKRGRYWIPKDQIAQWVTTKTGQRIPIPKKGYKGRPRKVGRRMLPLGHAEAKARVSSYNLPTPKQTRLSLQAHAAEKAGPHVDLRIAMDDKAYSWALPKGMPSAGGRALAVLQPPHTKSYMGFEGAIDTGYGKGAVKLAADTQVDVVRWDKTMKKFRIYAGPYKGTYHVIRGKIPGTKNWVLIRSRRLRRPIKDQWKLARARMKTKGFMWKSPEYVLQPKVDGARYALYTGVGGENRFLSRKVSKLGGGYVERTDNLPYIRGANLVPDSIVDGEVFIRDNETTARIMGSNPIRSRELQSKIGKPKFIVFDVLKYRGRDIRQLPYKERLKFVKKFVSNAKHPQIKRMPSIWKDKLNFAKHLIATGWEGAVLKDAKSHYYGNFQSKYKRFRTGDYVITGYTPGRGKIEGLVGAIELAETTPDGKLISRGRVGTGLSMERRRELTKQIDRMVKNRAVVEVKMLTKTSKGNPRAPVFMRLRPDKHWSQATG